MKKIIFPVLGIMLVSLAACRKDRTCACTVTETTNGSGTSETTSQTVGHATTTEAKRLTNCYSYTDSYTYTHAGTVFSVQTVAECKLN